MCGEHMRSRSRIWPARGSSPHVRGTPARPPSHPRRPGIIPACAGNTHTQHATIRPIRGSSPHVRGTRDLESGQLHVPGIIPACAGNTSTSRRARSSTRDHPRMCGEHKPSRMSMGVASGSSPHVRGTLRIELTSSLTTGIIPACAGNTHRHPHDDPYLRDHPRMCGEHTGEPW